MHIGGRFLCFGGISVTPLCRRHFAGIILAAVIFENFYRFYSLSVVQCRKVLCIKNSADWIFCIYIERGESL